MNYIPISFTHAGKQYSGVFSPVAGGGSNTMFHLMVDRYYIGQPVNTEHFGWRFSSNSKPELDKQADYFGDYVIAWYG